MYIIPWHVSSSPWRINQMNPSMSRKFKPYKMMPKQDLLLLEISRVIKIIYMHNKSGKL